MRQRQLQEIKSIFEDGFQDQEQIIQYKKRQFKLEDEIQIIKSLIQEKEKSK